MATLVADIGGTNARFALVDGHGRPRAQRTLAVADHRTFEEALDAYLGGLDERPEVACFAVAGPASGDRVAFTNSPWVVDGSDTETRYGLRRCLVVNDFQAVSRFAPIAGEADTVVLKDGTPVEGAPVLTIGPGTGLGQGLLVPTRHGPVTIATEGGHVLLAAADEQEAALIAIMARRLGRAVTAEDAVSGPGLVLLFEAVCQVEGLPAEPTMAPRISEAALAGEGPARRTVKAFCRFLATTASNACFATGARGGVVIAGGVLPRLLPLVEGSGFAERFEGTGKMRAYTAAVSVRLLTSGEAALRGAAALLEDAVGG
jgi:glucokinase